MRNRSAAVPESEAKNLPAILTAQHEDFSDGETTRLSTLPALKPWALTTTMRPGTTAAGPRSAGRPSARAVPAASATATAAAADVVRATPRSTTPSVSERP